MTQSISSLNAFYLNVITFNEILMVLNKGEHRSFQVVPSYVASLP